MSFTRPTLEEIDKRIRGDIRSVLQIAAVVRRTFFAAFSKAFSGVVHSLHGHLKWISKQAFPDQASGIYLKRWGSIYGKPQKEATFAVLAIAGSGTNGETIPVDTILQRDDGVEYKTNTGETIAGGIWSANVTTQTSGATGNLENGETLVFKTPIANVDATVTVTATVTEGENAESEDNHQGRIVQRIQEPPAGGKVTDYIAWALEVAGVTRVWAFPSNRGQGTMDVSFVEDNETPIIPGAPKVAEVQTKIDEEIPVGPDSIVFAPNPETVDMAIKLKPNTQATRDAVTAEIEDLFFREGEVSGAIDPNAIGTGGILDGKVPVSKIDEAISISSGEEDHLLVTPTVDIEPAHGYIVQVGTLTFQTLL